MSGRKLLTPIWVQLSAVILICSIFTVLSKIPYDALLTQRAHWLDPTKRLLTDYRGPTLLSNGPTTVEVQGRWIVDAIKQVERQGLKYINPKADAQAEYKKKINALSDISLFPTTKSTYMGGSKPDKAFEQTNWAGGIPAYHAEIRATLPDFAGFEKVKK